VRVIESYIDELGSALSGPGRAKSDLLTEACDSLVDAASAYRSEGLSWTEAQRRAVAEFGEVGLVAPGYQDELGLAQTRRTGLLVAAVVAAQPLVWRLHTGQGDGSPHPVYLALDEAMRWLGGLSIAAALLAVLAAGVGVRFLGVRSGLIRAAGRGGLLVAGSFTVFSLIMTLLATPRHCLLDANGVPYTVAFLVVPMTVVALSARRCLAAATSPGAAHPR